MKTKEQKQIINLLKLEESQKITEGLMPGVLCEWRLSSGQLHREFGPAKEYQDGTKEWYWKDNLHKNDGPAAIEENVSTMWYRHGQIHREDGPAIIYPNGHSSYYLYNQALKDFDQLKETVALRDKAKAEGKTFFTLEVSHLSVIVSFDFNGQKHNDEGPAIVNYDSVHESYWIHGLQYSEKEWRQELFKETKKDAE